MGTSEKEKLLRLKKERTTIHNLWFRSRYRHVKQKHLYDLVITVSTAIRGICLYLRNERQKSPIDHTHHFTTAALMLLIFFIGSFLKRTQKNRTLMKN